ncbi:hypothetical protein E3P99_01446 [Wallemia hederae]|uniref:Uncharacterized protein n=1 Tax=Wallemia hederae TaxID=1540922 RepID=A0A4T0FRV3_9BASI|nr:hypothetical protein E3P99_01446 [Wallemia hederae]
MTEKAQELQGSDIGSEISDDFSFDGDLKLLSSLSAEELNSYHLIVAHIEEDDKVVVADTINKDDKLVYTVNDHKKAVSFDDFVTNFRAQLSESARKEHDSLVAMYGDRDSEDEKAYVAYNEKLIAVTDVLAMELEGSEGLQKVCDEQEDKDASAIEALAKRVVDHYKDKTNGKKLAVVMSDPISTLNVYPDEYEVLPYALRDALLDAEAEVVMLDEEDAEEEQEEKKEEGSAEDKKHFKELQEALATQLESLVVELDREIVQQYIDKGELRSNDLDLLNESLQTTLRYVGFGAVAGAGSLFYLARRYQRRWALPAFAGGVSGTFLGQYAGAMSFASHFKQEGRDPRQVLGTLARISRESDVKRAERAAGSGESARGATGATGPTNGSSLPPRNDVIAKTGNSRWDELRRGGVAGNSDKTTSSTPPSASYTPPPATDPSASSFPRSSEDFDFVSDRDVTANRSSAEKDL